MSKSKSDTAGAADVDKYFEQITEINRQYRNVLDKIKMMRKSKNKADMLDLLTLRNDLKETFISKKRTARANIDLVKAKNPPLGALKEKELKDLQTDFRSIDQEFIEMGVMQERAELFDGAARNNDDPGRMNNTELLDKAHELQRDNKNKLVEGLRTIEITKSVAAETAATLSADQEKISRAMIGLDTVESELAISNKLITNFVKRMATDKVIIAFTFLILAGVVGIIIYATLNPDQDIFDVPEAAKPAILQSATGTPSATP